MNSYQTNLINSLGFNKENAKTRVVVAMSGGVDSSVVACLLKERGYQVIGVTLQLYDHGEAIKKKNSCCAGADIYDAKRVAQRFDFPHYVLNYQSLFRDAVINDFVESYAQGETPIPCVRCNQSVKFRDLLKVAKDLGADAMATGHYVRRIVDENGVACLHKAVDHSKDQSYFLFNTTKEQLDFLRFPLGSMTKEHTREEARRLDLSVASKPDSQDICFVPNGDYANIVRKYRPDAFKKGNFVHFKTGKILGEHEGIVNFTLGQRRGIGISNPEPLYVIKIDPVNNTVFVGEEEFLYKQRFVIKEVNWLMSNDEIKERYPKFSAFVRIRSTQEEKPASIKFLDASHHREIEIEMKSMTKAITPGQACVIYDNDRVLGGGWITREIK